MEISKFQINQPVDIEKKSIISQHFYHSTSVGAGSPKA
jgi:hypothetical protein